MQKILWKHVIKIIFMTTLLISTWAFSSVFANLPKFDEAYKTNRLAIFWFSNTNTPDSPKTNNYVENIANGLYRSNTTKTNRSLVLNYCNVVLNDNTYLLVGDEKAEKQQFMYDPRQSMFVLSLCMTVNPQYDRYFPLLQNEDGTYYKKYNLSDFGMPIYKGSSCSTSWDMNHCDLYKYIPKLFNETINDYVNIKQANILWVQNPNFNEGEGMKVEDQANDLMKERFYGQMLCDINGEKDSKCDYPKTMKHVKEYIRKSAKLIKQAKVINYNKIILDATAEKGKRTEKECGLSSKREWNYNIIMCWLLWEKEAHMEAFMNVLYNELFYYRLFITYYSTDIKIPNQNESAEKMRQELVRSQDAVDLSLQMLKELYFAYPLHLGFTLYLEDLISLRKELVKIVTPISTLYDKLRNVQEKSN